MSRDIVEVNCAKDIAMAKKLIDDGFAPELVKGAEFQGILEMPVIHREKVKHLPSRLRPFSQRGVTAMLDEYMCFYEHDKRFEQILLSARAYLSAVKKFGGIVSPDCSLYVDMPLVLQLVNTYLNRALGHYFQYHGITVIPNVRWGDERSYLGIPGELEPFAFLGIERGSVVSVGTYGCIRGREAKYHFKEGLKAMVRTIMPEKVLVYGSMPDVLFYEVSDSCEFVRYPDWISLRKGGG